MKIYFKILIIFFLLNNALLAQGWVFKDMKAFEFDSLLDDYPILYPRDMSIFQDNIIIPRFWGDIYNNVREPEYMQFQTDSFLLYNSYKFYNKRDLTKLIKDTNTLKMADFTNGLNHMEFDSAGNIWGCSVKTLFYLSKNKDSIKIFNQFYNLDSNKFFDINKIRRIKIDRNNRVWVLVDLSYGKFCLTYMENDTLKRYYYYSDSSPIGGIFFVENFAFDRENRLWLNKGDSLLFFKDKNNIIGYYFNYLNDTISYSEIYKIIFNKDNIPFTVTCSYIFLKTDKSVSNPDFKWHDDITLFKQYLARPSGEGYYEVLTCMDSSGNFWVSYLLANILNKLSPDGVWTSYNMPIDQQNYYGMEADSKGRIWLASVWGILMFDPKMNAVEENTPNSKGSFSNIYPNPTSNKSTIKFDLEQPANVSLKLTDILGNQITLIDNQFMESGSHSYDWDASCFPAGVYYYVLQAGGNVRTGKVVVMK
jgi:hypothetical protein